jgi:hypothetical protein
VNSPQLKFPGVLIEIVRLFPRCKAKFFLSFGEPSEAESLLIRQQWSGLIVRPPHYQNLKPYEGDGLVRRLYGQLAADPQFVKTLTGGYVRAITIGEIYTQFIGEAVDMVLMNLPDQNRMIWDNKQIRDSHAKLYLMPEDGHNEEVIKEGKARGYAFRVVDDQLLLIRDPIHD